MVLSSVLLSRALGSQFESHWGVSLFASIWLMLMLVQLYRLRAQGATGMLSWVRRVLAAISNGTEVGDVSTLANPEIVEDIRKMVQGS